MLVEGTKTGVASPPGFPSLRSLKFATRLQNVGAMVFSSASRKESLILSVADLSEVRTRGRTDLGANSERMRNTAGVLRGCCGSGCRFTP